MQFAAIDWIVLVGCVVVIFAPALFFARRANRNTTEFFASGRSAPWWLVGTSMVATTFATDTPGLVAQLVREQGIAGNWAWWAFLFSGMATVFIYARLWRRAELLTDLEFYEIRYSGPPAALVRGFRAIYLGLVFNCFIMATVTLAAVKISGVLLGVPAWKTIVVAIILCSAISTVSGLWGVLVSDLVQFGVAMTGSICAAVYALRHPAVGGLAGLVDKLDASTLRMLPDFGSDGSASFAASPLWTIFLVPLLIQWWATWYPGSEPGGGNYIAQRILAAKNERHAAGATLWFNVAHYALRPWPWIIVGLASIVVFPHLDDLRTAFPNMQPGLIDHDVAYPAMLTFLPAGVLGLVAASLLAAYVSTMSTQLNLGASYLVNDFYRRFFAPDASQGRLLWVSRLLTVGLMCAAGCLVFVIDSARAGFEMLLTIGAGTGAIYLLRWFWWRINAWSEIAAMVSSFLISMTILGVNRFSPGAIAGNNALILTVAVTTIVWVAVTYLTKPESPATLTEFVRRTNPAGPGWRRIRQAANLPPSGDSLGRGIACWLLGCAAVYTVLFGTGCLLFGRTARGAVLLAMAAISAAALFAVLRGSRAKATATEPRP